MNTPTENVSNATSSPAVHTPSKMIPIAQIKPSKNNPRKTFDAKKLEELAASITVDGILEDLTVRPVAGAVPFELVFGERRYRAAKMAGLELLPCKVKELTDERALELAIVENSQREDVDPLEEAEGFEKLHAPKAKGGLGQSVEEIAAKIGKSTGHVYNRLKLAELGEDGRKAYRAGDLTVYTAMLIARIPHHDLQKKAIARIKSRAYNGEPIRAREAAEIVRREFMLDLARASFDKKSLALYPAAGACSVCPKRTGNQPELFGDATSKEKDVCTDPKCYEIKLKAHNETELKRRADKGVTVLGAAQTKKIFGSNGGYAHASTGFVATDQQCHEDPKYRPFEKLLKGLDVQRFAAVKPNGEIVELVKPAEAMRAMKEAGVISKSANTGAGPAASANNREKERRRKLAVTKEITARAFVEIAERVQKKEPNEKALWSLLLGAFAQVANYEAAALAATLLGKNVDRGRNEPARLLVAETRNMSASQVRALVVQLAAGVGAFYRETPGEHLKAAAALYGVDLGKIATTIKAEQTKKPKMGKVPAKEIKAAAKKAKAARPAKKGRRS